MAMNAGEVAKFADIDLQDLRPGVTQRQRVLGQLSRETILAIKFMGRERLAPR